jgi:hypothetical protein
MLSGSLRRYREWLELQARELDVRRLRILVVFSYQNCAPPEQRTGFDG